MKQTNILWEGIEYHSLENCVISESDEYVEINSTIVGAYQGSIYQVEYSIQTTKKWQCTVARLNTRYGNRKKQIELIRSAEGIWKLNGETVADFDLCNDVDIPLTPFTNTLPINRLRLAVSEQQLINVIYIDIPNDSIRKVKQKYTRTRVDKYHYENVPNDFDAEILVDENGFVVDYPELFTRAAKQQTAIDLRF